MSKHPQPRFAELFAAIAFVIIMAWLILKR
jgi:flagellar biogenesis protein FliO